MLPGYGFPEDGDGGHGFEDPGSGDSVEKENNVNNESDGEKIIRAEVHNYD